MDVITFLENMYGEERANNVYYTKKAKSLNGILHLIDAVQDAAVDEYDYPEDTVFWLKE